MHIATALTFTSFKVLRNFPTLHDYPSVCKDVYTRQFLLPIGIELRLLLTSVNFVFPSHSIATLPAFRTDVIHRKVNAIPGSFTIQAVISFLTRFAGTAFCYTPSLAECCHIHISV